MVDSYTMQPLYATASVKVTFGKRRDHFFISCSNIFGHPLLKCLTTNRLRTIDSQCTRRAHSLASRRSFNVVNVIHPPRPPTIVQKTLNLVVNKEFLEHPLEALASFSLFSSLLPRYCRHRRHLLFGRPCGLVCLSKVQFLTYVFLVFVFSRVVGRIPTL